MAIIIRNIETLDDGFCKYELRINEKVITHFMHRRSDGLATCLGIASLAAKMATNEPTQQTLDDDTRTVKDQIAEWDPNYLKDLFNKPLK